MNEPDDEELALQARECPVIRGAMGTGDPAAIDAAMRMHPPSKCACVKQAREAAGAAM